MVTTIPQVARALRAGLTTTAAATAQMLHLTWTPQT